MLASTNILWLRSSERQIHRCLSAGGRLVLDVFDPWLEKLVDEADLKEQPQGEPFDMPDGRQVKRCERVTHRDRARQMIHIELIYYVTHPDDREQRQVHSFPMRYFFRFELEHLLARCGFEIENLYSGYDRSPIGAKLPGELIFVARKT